MIDDIVFEDVKFLIFEKGNIVTGVITAIDLNGGSAASSTNIQTGEVYI